MVQKPSFAQRLKTLNIGRSHDIHYTLLSVSLRLSRPVLHCLGANGRMAQKRLSCISSSFMITASIIAA